MSLMCRFGLSGSPFPLFPDPQRWFPLRSSVATLEHLQARLRDGDRLLTLTGPEGIGKSTLCAKLLRDIPSPLSALCITIPGDNNSKSLERLLLGALSHGVHPEGEGEEHDMIIRLLLGRRPSRTPCLVIIDDAHYLPSRALLFLHSLLAMHREGGPILRVVLCGADDLLPRLNHPLFRALSSLPTHFLSLQPMNAGETIAYIDHHLNLAALPDHPAARPFSPEALGILVVDSQGLPGRVNQLCDKALHAAAQRGDILVRPEDLGYQSAFTPTHGQKKQVGITQASILAGFGGMLAGALIAAFFTGIIPVLDSNSELEPIALDKEGSSLLTGTRAHPPLSIVLSEKPDPPAPPPQLDGHQDESGSSTACRDQQGRWLWSSTACPNNPDSTVKP
ncbi:AAA family ATPase [Haematospirillum jordaniae]|nr:AAA family ATPase [Haematospirillum jordaniae]NKD45045.1 AAA family ATPase [Haematospirillum jordaniae]NKD57136.1 AAA family ATPase [Haematospirillum jordaniae]NKD59369.1 AAA family ATPase [Haematospirillum jordaniae]NKD67062.1 AAA family ATPase [Haematospirillum jordaniae]NKD79351.1 AAA family ATPase [Haematospirillum jordaniae]